MMREAAARKAEFVVFPELALTTFFPRYWMEDAEAVERYFEKSMPDADVQPLFDTARIDLAMGQTFRDHVFNFAKHRSPQHYRLIVERTGAGEPLAVPEID